MSKREKEQLVERAQSLLVTGTSYQATARTIAGEFGLTLRSAETYVTRARKDWAEEHARWTREEERARHAEMARYMYLSALAHHEIEMSKGRPVRDKNGEVVKYHKPDRKTALKALDVLCRIKGSYKHTIEIEYEGNAAKFLDAVIGSLSDRPDVQEIVIEEAKKLL